MIDLILQTIVDIIHKLGYPGLFVMTFLEGTFVPIPSEITLVPAGYLISQGEFDFWIVLLCSIAGTMSGVLFNYFLAYHFGRQLLIKYGKYFFFTENKLKKMEKFFHNHGSFSIFIGRIAPGIKHFISFPAGLAKMNLKLFCIYSALGGTIWVSVLIVTGMFIGNNSDEIHHYVQEITVILLVFAVFATAIYMYCHKRKKRRIRESTRED
jgi:membrane protein DedA with SNARE-associated domain